MKGMYLATSLAAAAYSFVAAPPELTPVAPLTPAKWESRVVKPGLVVQRAEPASTWTTHSDGVALYTFEKGAYGVFALAPGQRVRVEVVGPAGDSRRVEFVGDSKDLPPEKDPLAERLKAAWGKEPSPSKEHAKLLAELYRQCANGPCKTAATGQELVDLARDTSKILLKDSPDALLQVRGVVSAELKAVLPELSAALTEEKREALSALFTRLSLVLEGF
jgi:hypothetical protein